MPEDSTPDANTRPSDPLADEFAIEDLRFRFLPSGAVSIVDPLDHTISWKRAREIIELTLRFYGRDGELIPEESRIKPRRAPRPPRPEYVYIVRQEGQECCKIGRTSDLPGRVMTMRTYAERSIEVVAAIPTSDAKALEAKLHDHYASKRRQGEWFALTPEDVAEIKAQVSPWPDAPPTPQNT